MHSRLPGSPFERQGRDARGMGMAGRPGNPQVRACIAWFRWEAAAGGMCSWMRNACMLAGPWQN